VVTRDLDLPAACVIYGAGSFGRRLAEAVEDAGTVVKALIDFRRPAAGPGVPVLHPQEALSSEVLPVLLGVCNPEVDIRSLTSELHSVGFSDVRTPVQAAIALGARGGKIACYWLSSDPSIYTRAEPEVGLARALLGDPQSVDIFDRVLEYRETGEAAVLPEVSPVGRQYMGDGLGYVHAPIRLLDAGAFTGDTIRAFVAAGLHLESVIALEPDPENFALLGAQLDQLQDIQSIALPVALSDRTGLVRFAADSTAAAKVDAGGSNEVLAVAGDDLLHGWSPTHIKMDIEGSEPAALLGLTRTITTHRPGLSISAYHEPEHLWTLVAWLGDLGLDYTFHLRCYGQQTFDTVLYAIPQD
jgi:FkbM family methyltransferase